MTHRPDQPVVSVQLPDYVITDIDACAESHDMTRSDYLRRALASYLRTCEEHNNSEIWINEIIYETRRNK